MSNERSYPVQYKWLHLYSILVVITTAVLIGVGGHVNSTGSGLAVPDWPLTYDQNPITYPLHKWQGGILWEHGHRLLAMVEGLLIFIEMLWIFRVERADSRRWLRVFSLIAFVAVCLQGALGGITVLLGLSTIVSTLHAILAHSLMASAVAMALATSRSWITMEKRSVQVSHTLQKTMLVTVAAAFIQVLLGALVRHTYSGLAIQDFPLAFGQVFPPLPTVGIALHYFHRVGAVIVTILIFTQSIRILRHSRELPMLKFPALLLMGLVVVQVTLGAFVIWTQEHIVINTLHVFCGTGVLATAFATYFLSNRFYSFASQQQRPVATMPEAGHLQR